MMWFKSKDQQILELKAQVKELERWKYFSDRKTDELIKRVCNFYSPNELVLYLKLKAKVNQAIGDIVGEIHDGSYPNMMDDSIHKMMVKIEYMKNKFMADLEAGRILMQELKKGTDESK